MTYFRSSGVLTALSLVLWSGAAAASEPPGEDPRTCEQCHFEETDAVVEFPDGSALSAWVDPESWQRSVHFGEIECQDCHRWVREHPHPALAFESDREYQVAQAKSCNRCHLEHYKESADGIHFAELSKGNLDAPTCVDCHGAHDTLPATGLDVSLRCAGCHEEVARVYERSVHGSALAGGNPDTPLCTDCHGTHRIADPKTSEFHAGSYLICARCHGDRALMKKYDLNPEVLNTYLDDFHGRSNHIYIEVGHIPERPMAVCSDCHGFHDVQKIDRQVGIDVAKAKAAAMCRECHEGAPDDFGDAWLAHGSPSFRSTPAVAAVAWTYRLMIPLMLLGLILHILLDLWRVRTPRGAED